MKGNIPLYLILAGVILHVVDLVTSKEGKGGVVFGPTGFLTGVNNMLPQVKVPGTDIPITLGGWLILTGATWYAVTEWVL